LTGQKYGMFTKTKNVAENVRIRKIVKSLTNAGIYNNTICQRANNVKTQDNLETFLQRKFNCYARYKAITPGYRMAAIEKISNSQYSDPLFLKEFKNVMEKVAAILGKNIPLSYANPIFSKATLNKFIKNMKNKYNKKGIRRENTNTSLNNIGYIIKYYPKFVGPITSSNRPRESYAQDHGQGTIW
jgi:hypothetical protein